MGSVPVKMTLDIGVVALTVLMMAIVGMEREVSQLRNLSGHGCASNPFFRT
jgi:hypothetical protein